MAEPTRRSMSDIRPPQGRKTVKPAGSHKHKKPEPVAAPKVVSKPDPAPKPKAPEPMLEVEKFMELPAPKKRRGTKVLLFLLGLGLIAATAYGLYLAYLTFYQ
jgi:hypothetical protein